MRHMINQVRNKGKRIVFPEGDNEKVLRAAAQLFEQKYVIQYFLAPKTEFIEWLTSLVYISNTRFLIHVKIHEGRAFMLKQ